MVLSDVDGTVERVTARKITIRTPISKSEDLHQIANDGMTEFNLIKFLRTNQDTCINQKPLVKVGDKIKKGDIIADGAATDRGELALGQNILVAFMPWHGYNYEDAIVVSERLARDDVFSSLHIEEYELQVRDTKRGEEELTREIPNVSEEATRNLDESGVIRIGAEVEPGDILVGKVTPKGETDPTPEEKLLKAIFGEKAGDVKDASLKASPGVYGVVVDTKVFTRTQITVDGNGANSQPRIGGRTGGVDECTLSCVEATEVRRGGSVECECIGEELARQDDDVVTGGAQGVA